jgi:hypothetical protein
MEALILEPIKTEKIVLSKSTVGQNTFKFQFADEQIFYQDFSDENLEAIEEFPGIVACSCGGCTSACKTTNKCSSPS